MIFDFSCLKRTLTVLGLFIIKRKDVGPFESHDGRYTVLASKRNAPVGNLV